MGMLRQHMSRLRSSWSERGASAVEFAIILPVLLILIGGLIDFGRLYFLNIVLTNAAREGSRAGVVVTTPISGQCPSSVDDCIRARTVAAASPYTVSDLTVTVNSNCTGVSPTQTSVTVKPSTPFKWTMLGAVAGITPPLVSATSVMRCNGT